MPADRVEYRKQGFKARGMTGDESRRHREEASVEIRKVKREESMNKKRAAMLGSASVEQAAPMSDDEVSLDELDSFSNEGVKQRMPQLLAQLNSSVLEEQIEGTTSIRKILSKERNPPITVVIQSGAIPRLVQFLKGHQFSSSLNNPEEIQKSVENLQFEAAWSLTNVASGNSQQTWTIVQNDAILPFINLLGSPNKDVQEQVVWALGNIAGDSPTCRDLVLNANILPPLLALIHSAATETPTRLSLLRNASWTLSNLCRGKPLPDWTKVVTSLPVLAGLLTSSDRELLTDACWALSYLSDGPNDHIEDVIRAGVVPRLIQLLGHESYAIQTPALRAIGNIVTGNDSQTEIVVANGGLQAFYRLLQSPRINILKEVCWAISNITAGNVTQIQSVIDAGLIPLVVNLINTSDFKVKKEACWALSNATSGKSTCPDQISYLVSQGVLKPFSDILKCQDNRIVNITLDAIDAILEVGEGMRYSNPEMVNPYAILLEEAGGMDTVSDLQCHANIEIYEKSKRILDRYFSDADADFNVDSQTAAAGFQFSTDQSQSGGFTF